MCTLPANFAVPQEIDLYVFDLWSNKDRCKKKKKKFINIKTKVTTDSQSCKMSSLSTSFKNIFDILHSHMVILNIPVNSDLDAEKKPITFNETLFR